MGDVAMNIARALSFHDCASLEFRGGSSGEFRASSGDMRLNYYELSLVSLYPGKVVKYKG